MRKGEARLAIAFSCGDIGIVAVLRSPQRIENLIVAEDLFSAVEKFASSSLREQVRYAWPEPLANKLGVPLLGLEKYGGDCAAYVREVIERVCKSIARLRSTLKENIKKRGVRPEDEPG
ncbi:MAG: hypothetical protein ABWW70_03130 [Thermoproteota archaeon]